MTLNEITPLNQKDLYAAINKLEQHYICELSTTSSALLRDDAEQKQKLNEFLILKQVILNNPGLHCSVNDLYTALKEFSHDSCASTVVNGARDINTVNKATNIGVGMRAACVSS